MANITEVSEFTAAVPELATNTQAIGGPGGAMNSQAQALANRTKYLKDTLDALGDASTKNVGTGAGDVAAGDAPAAAQAAAEATAAGALAGHVADADPHTQYQKEADLAADMATLTHGLTTKASPADADEIGFWDSVASALKKLTFANLWTWIQSKIHAASNKDVLVDADKFAIVDNEALNVTKTTTWANIKAKIATFLDRASTTVKGTLLLGASGGAAKLTAMPDGATAISGGYEDAWATTAGWSAGAGATIDVSTTPGALRITATTTSGFFANKSIAGMAGKIMFVRYRTSANATGVRVFDGTNTIATLPVSTNFTVGLVLIPVTSISAMYFGQSTGYVSGSWVEIDGYWIGDYSYLDGSLSEEAARIANELGDTAGVAAAAGGNINFSADNPVQVGDTVTAYGKTYQYVASLSASPGVEGEILWDADVYVNHERLRTAIATGNAGTTSWTTAHPLITMARPGGNLIGIVSARTPGINGNKIVLSALAAAVSGGRITLSNANGTTGNPINLSGGKDAVGEKIRTQVENYIAASGTRPAAAKVELTNTSYIGYETTVDVASGGTFTLPSGGTWYWNVYGYGATISSAKRGSSAGGTTLTVAGANASVGYRRVA